MPRRDEGFFSARDNTRLYWQSLLPDDQPTGWVGIVHGYGDHAGRYQHVQEHLVAEGLGTVALDYRGHGKADGRRGYCNNWQDFVDDLEVFWARLRGMAQGRPAFVLAHSHGALMALHWVLRRPEGLKGLVLTAPYLKLAFEPPAIKVVASKIAGVVVPWLRISSGLTPQMLSRDLAWQQSSAEDPLGQLATVTPRFFVQSTAAQEVARRRAKEVEVPMFMVTGGADPIASTPAARAMFETAGSADKTYKEYPEFLHEVLCETGKEQVLTDISRWISAHR